MNGFGAVSFLVGAVGENVDQLAMFSWLEIELARRHETGAIRYIILPPSRGFPSVRWTHFSYCHGAWICSSQPHELRLSTWPLRDMNFVVNIFLFFLFSCVCV